MTEIRTSEEIAEIAGALAKAALDIQNVGKTGTAKANSFNYNYAQLPEVLDEARPKLAKQGVFVLQSPVNGEGSNIGVVTRLLHSSGQWIESTLYVAPTKFDAQGVGSVITYLRRYALMAMVGIGAEDDDAQAAVGRPQAPQPRRLARDPSEAEPTSHDDANAHRQAQALARKAAALPPNPEDPPEVAANRNQVRDLIAKINGHIKTAPNDHALDMAMEDSREEMAEIERAGPAGVEAANTLRARYARRIGELRGGASA